MSHGEVVGRSPDTGGELLDSADQSGSSLASGRTSVSFDEFYARELPRLVAFARALCGRAYSDDVAQDAMIAAYRRWDDIGGYISPEAWVRRVCANLATSMVRRRAAEARAILRLSSRPTDTPRALEFEEFWSEVRRLPRRQGQAVALRYVYDMPVEQIADTLGCSPGSVKVHLSRARAKLAERLKLAKGDTA